MFFPYRDDNPCHRFPEVTVTLIAINILVFLKFALFSPYYENILWQYCFIPNEWAPYTLITSLFLHGSLSHLVSNMWYLWLFGDNLEDRLGKFFFLGFYLWGGIFSLLVHSYFADDVSRNIPTIGASGAISAVMGGYLVFYPFSKIRTFAWFFAIFQFKMSAWYFMVFWFIMQLFSTMNQFAVDATNVAYWAHIGGFASGFILALIFRMIL